MERDGVIGPADGAKPREVYARKSKKTKLTFGRFARCLGLAVATLSEISVQPCGGDQQRRDAIVDALQKSYDATADFVADFRQETEVKTLDRTSKRRAK